MTAATPTWPHYRDMTPEQMLAWGRAESAARQADLADRTAVGLRRARENAEARRRAIGATRSAAAALVIDATRADSRLRAATPTTQEQKKP